ncbi:MAG: hypothetical protein JJE04_02770 [Acidobacteriia bacterium]|nr:hypothetical protein [Terriglobia bacterium]
MTTNWMPFVVVWALVAIAVFVLAMYRKLVASHEDDMLHVRDSEVKLVAEQDAVARKLVVIDRWGKTLTVAALVYGFILAGFYVYSGWLQSNATAAVSVVR